jgi:hypothetical protein
MQQPTYVGLHVRTLADAEVIFHAVHQGLLRMVTRRLDTEERRAISSGCVYVWEERGANADANGVLGIERWTDSIQWGPSRVKDEFLFYHERRESGPDPDLTSDSDTTMRAGNRPRLTKQTYSVYLNTPQGRRKWHLIAYLVPETVHQLNTINDDPMLASLYVPRGMYTSARSSKTRPKDSILSSTNGNSVSIPRRRIADIQPPLLMPVRPLDDAQVLAPLAYLNSCAPPRRHILDEMALMSFPAIP